MSRCWGPTLGSDAGVLRWRRASGEEAQARAKVVVNAGGASIDAVNAGLGIESRLMGGSRGSHLIVDNPTLLHALDGRMVYFGTPDGRVNFLYPFQSKVLVGATDIAQSKPDEARCTADEEAYLCAAVAEIFPDIPILPGQVVHRFRGVRPLPRAGGDVGAVTRDHSIVTLALPGSGAPVHCLIGGKWTTFRAFAELASDWVLADLGLARKVTTAGLAIGGGKEFPRKVAVRRSLAEGLARRGGITVERAEVLFQRYGTRAEGYVQALCGRGETMLSSLPDYAREEIRHIAATERVGAVEDILRRRTLIALTGRETAAVGTEIASLLEARPERESA